ncbi:hypothetical protein B6A42_19855 [Vibrio coralliilyticus]|nr:hypothetical protein B6A42_19855 [Vibrio coralliilyticus]
MLPDVSLFQKLKVLWVSLLGVVLAGCWSDSSPLNNSGGALMMHKQPIIMFLQFKSIMRTARFLKVW